MPTSMMVEAWDN